MPAAEIGRAAARRHGALCRAVDGGVRGAVRHAPHRRDRASGRPDARGRGRIDRQAVVLPGGRHLRHLLDVRRPGRAVQQGDELAAGRFGAHPRAATRHAAGEHAAVVFRDPAAAAAIPRRRRREQRRARDQARALDVSDLSRADQPVRGADRDRRPDDLPGRPGRRRHVRAGAAAAGRIGRLHHPGLRRRPVGRDRHGDRRDGGARHHGVERHRRAAGCCNGARR